MLHNLFPSGVGSQKICDKRLYSMYNWTATVISAFPRSSGTKIKKMNGSENNLSIPVRQADVTGCQTDIQWEDRNAGGNNKNIL